MMPINAVESVTMTVAEMDRSIHFYTTILGCQKLADLQVSDLELDLQPETLRYRERCQGLSNVQLRVVQLQLGDQSFELIEFITPKGRPMPADSRSNDLWFQHIAIVVADMEQAYQQLHERWVSQTSPHPQILPAWNPVAGGIESFYFKDPDGHNLELIHFPAAKGDPKWQKPTKSLFLGIDHTAIVVANTAISLAFYCDLLGMKLQQQSENFGAEQERLSDVPHAKVKISSLRAAAGLGIELLEYIEPNTGRPMPIDTHCNDLWCFQTMVTWQDPISKFQQLEAVQFPPHATAPTPSDLGSGQGCPIQDPDGHLINPIFISC